MLIQSDFPTKLIINWNELNMAIFCCISHVSPAISKYLLRYKQMNITNQLKYILTDAQCILHVCRQSVCTCTFAIKFTYVASRGFPTYFKCMSDLCGELTLSCSRKFLSNANLTKSFFCLRICASQQITSTVWRELPYVDQCR